MSRQKQRAGHREQQPGRPNATTLDSSPEAADVIVVGAGLAGLTAAREILRNGAQPIVLEARSRIGGRVLSEPIGDGQVVEMGGQWLAPRNTRLTALATEAGLGLFPTYLQGASLLVIGGRVRRQRRAIPPLRPAALLDLAWARFRLDRLAQTVPPRAPWKAPHARELDAATLGSWIDENLRTREGAALLRVAARTIWGGEPERLNLLQILGYIHGAGNFNALTTRELQTRVVGGSARLADALAADLGDRILLEHPVSRIAHGSDGVEVQAAGRVFTAARVIVAVPPELAAELAFEPELPPQRARALRSLPMAAVTKVVAVYDRPFWREQGLSGQAIVSTGFVSAVFDNSPSDGKQGVLLGFVAGELSRQLSALGANLRQAAALETFTRLFGPQAASPLLFLEKDWSSDPWTRGCYFGLATAGSLTGELRTLAAPAGRVHWAGAETATENYGGMDGAVSSGMRAAAEVLAGIGITA